MYPTSCSDNQNWTSSVLLLLPGVTLSSQPPFILENHCNNALYLQVSYYPWPHLDHSSCNKEWLPHKSCKFQVYNIGGKLLTHTLKNTNWHHSNTKSPSVGLQVSGTTGPSGQSDLSPQRRDLQLPPNVQ